MKRKSVFSTQPVGISSCTKRSDGRTYLMKRVMSTVGALLSTFVTVSSVRANPEKLISTVWRLPGGPKILLWMETRQKCSVSSKNIFVSTINVSVFNFRLKLKPGSFQSLRSGPFTGSTPAVLSASIFELLCLMIETLLFSRPSSSSLLPAVFAHSAALWKLEERKDTQVETLKVLQGFEGEPAFFFLLLFVEE